MLAIASWLRRHAIESLWGLFAAANIAFIAFFPAWETIPFHFVWVSLMLVYWLRLWGPRTTALVLAAVCVGTGTVLVWGALRLGEGLDEVAEVPLMAAMFVAMSWHAHRRQAAVQQIWRMARSERDFASNASHELRTPITVARGHAELIRAAHPGQQTGADAEVILDELSRLWTISDRLLTLAAAENPGFLYYESVDLQLLISRTAARWSAAAQREWELNATAEGALLADAERLETALDALLENAVKYTGEGDRIAIMARADGETAVIEVSDGGVGIAEEYLPKIFDRFFRADDGRASRDRGTGLGLAIVKAIVEAHGGVVTATSSVGKGTTFRIRIRGFADPTAAQRSRQRADAKTPGFVLDGH